jgi:hypothetical protein
MYEEQNVKNVPDGHLRKTSFGQRINSIHKIKIRKFIF